MGAVDLVIQIEAPPSVAPRHAAHRPRRPPVGAVERRRPLPEVPRRSPRVRRRGRAPWRAAMSRRPVPAQSARRARAADRRDRGASAASRAESDGRSVSSAVERDLVSPSGVSATALRPRSPRAPFALARVFEGVLDMLAGRYPSDEFAELRPRITWDRIATCSRRAPARSASPSSTPARFPIAASTACSSPASEGDGRARRRARRGDGLRARAPARPSSSARRRGASSEITRDRVLVTPAPGEPGKMPFWHGDRPGRPLEFGRAHRHADARARGAAAAGRARRASSTTHHLDARAAENLLAYLPTRPRRRGAVPRRPHHRRRARAATSSATGASACSRRSAAASTRPGPWP